MGRGLWAGPLGVAFGVWLGEQVVFSFSGKEAGGQRGSSTPQSSQRIRGTRSYALLSHGQAHPTTLVLLIPM